MIHEINKLLNDKAKVTKELREYVKDKNIPLDQRWDLFIYSELGTHHKYIIHPDGLDEDKYFDTIDFDRGTIIIVEDFLENIKILDVEDPEEDKILEDEVVFKEWCLDKFIKSFTFDW